MAKGVHCTSLGFVPTSTTLSQQLSISSLSWVITRMLLPFRASPLSLSATRRKYSMHQFPPERLVAVHEPQPAEDRQDQIFLHLLDLTERCNGLAGRVIAHNGDAVVGAAYAVVEVPFATQVGTPVGEKLRILPLYLFPYRLPLCRGIVQGDLRPYLLLAGIGIQHMAFAVEWELLVLHLPASPSLPRRDAEPAFPFVYLHLVKTRLFQIRL